MARAHKAYTPAFKLQAVAMITDQKLSVADMTYVPTRERAVSDPSVSHLFVRRRDRLGRPDNPLDSMLIEYQLRSAGLTTVLMGGKVLPAVGPSEQELA